ncbi:MAG: isoprenylcysteine carboxylmethyltransferase family protein [Chloroflexota bacterium]|nr:isoprenylcysteine carboxylmethyltransferase family protein [Chloroflexota bacterium]
MHLRVPRAVALMAQAGVFPALFVGAPLALSELGQRHGWSAGRPGRANLAGVLPLGAGAGLLVWAMSSHYRAAPEGWEVAPTPDYLLAGGAYQFSRNPMYVGEAAIWTGWAVFFGSLPVAAGLATLTAVQSGAIRIEERVLHKRWGDSYDEYRARVPRWVRLPALTRPPVGGHHSS